MAERRIAEPDRYPPIADHGVIGDLRTVALVALDGTIDFFCFPDFDSPSAFARLLDHDRGGAWTFAPDRPQGRRTQIYLPDTNVLVTRFLSDQGILELTDFMPIGGDDEPSRIVRIARAVRGEIDVAMRCAPAFDYGAAACEAILGEEGRRATLRGGGAAMSLSGTHEMVEEGGAAVARFTLRNEEMAAFTLTCSERDGRPAEIDEAREALVATELWWRKWLAQSTYRGRWSEMVGRSALVLKLMCSAKHGSLIAAATFGLPEDIGGPRNFDYRYCWIRDAAFTIYALIRLGFSEEAGAFTKWVTDRIDQCDGPGIALCYRTDGSPPPEERELDAFEGYRGSRPVRVGNAAAKQTQLDIYGELLDAVYLTDKHGGKLSYETWVATTRLVEHVCERWDEPDAGIWEFRAEEKHFLHSRLMCWVAIDRACRIAGKESLPAPLDRWRETRDAIWRDIHETFWDPEEKTFVQHRGAKAVDASALMMPLVKFISAKDPRFLSTLETVRRRLTSDVLVHRYDGGEVTDGFDDSREGGFTMCSFWYVEALARAGRGEEARLLFEKMMSYANHLGLYSEELGLDGAQLGNFPQAFTHLALISAAHAIDAALEGVAPG